MSIDLGNINFMDYVEEDNTSEIFQPEHYRDKLHDLFENPDLSNGYSLAWRKTFEHFGVRPGEVTAISGFNGHYKTSFTLQTSVALIEQGAKVVCASMEMPPEKTLKRMATILSGVTEPSRKYRDCMIDWLNGKFWLYDRHDQVAFDEIKGLIVYSATVLKASVIIIDSLMKCGVDSDDYKGQGNFIDMLCQQAKKYGIHIMLVAHSRKGEETLMPSRYDISGSANISNLVDNIVIVWMDKALIERKRFNQYKEGDEDKAEVKIWITKQRNAEFEGTFFFWTSACMQLLESSKNKPKWYDIGFTK